MTNKTTEAAEVANTFEHAYFCLPQPGETGPRMERYLVPRYSDAGVQVGTSMALRCQECGEITYDGVNLHGGSLPTINPAR